MRLKHAVALMLVTSPVLAQQPVHVVSPGMSKAQVLAALGEPITLREAAGFTYIFYHNGCERRCGTNDIVVLRADSVVDAIFRSPSRRYTGTSSSPAAVPAKVARRGPAAVAAAETRADTTVRPRMKPAPASDTRPSIPLNPPKVRP